MSSSSTTGNTTQNSSGPEDNNNNNNNNLQLLMDQRKRKRMESNRESAKRSRMRKQKHLDELMGQVTQLRKENNEIATSISVTTQHYGKVEAENSVLRAQVMELTQRLHSLNEILNYVNTLGNCNMNNSININNNNSSGGGCMFETEDYFQNHLVGNLIGDGLMNMSSNNLMGFGQSLQCPIVGSADMFGYY